MLGSKSTTKSAGCEWFEAEFVWHWVGVL